MHFNIHQLHCVNRMSTPCPGKWTRGHPMGLLTNTQNRGLRMRREYREHFPRHWLQRKPLASDPGMHHGTCVTHVTWCMSGSLNHAGGGKRSQHCRRMRNSQFYVSGKRPIITFVMGPEQTACCVRLYIWQILLYVLFEVAIKKYIDKIFFIFSSTLVLTFSYRRSLYTFYFYWPVSDHNIIQES